MKNEEFITLLEKPEQTAEKNIDELKSFAREYPYSQVAQLLYAIRLRHSSEHLFNQQLGKASILTNDRTVLYELFEGNNELVEPKEGKKPAEINEEGYWVKPYRPETLEPLPPESEIPQKQDKEEAAESTEDAETEKETKTKESDLETASASSPQEGEDAESQGVTQVDSVPSVEDGERASRATEPEENAEQLNSQSDAAWESNETADIEAVETDDSEEGAATEGEKDEHTKSGVASSEEGGSDRAAQEEYLNPEDKVTSKDEDESEKGLPKDERLRAIVLKNRALRKSFQENRSQSKSEQPVDPEMDNADLEAKKEELREERAAMQADSKHQEQGQTTEQIEEASDLTSPTHEQGQDQNQGNEAEGQSELAGSEASVAETESEGTARDGDIAETDDNTQGETPDNREGEKPVADTTTEAGYDKEPEEVDNSFAENEKIESRKESGDENEREEAQEETDVNSREKATTNRKNGDESEIQEWDSKPEEHASVIADKEKAEAGDAGQVEAPKEASPEVSEENLEERKSGDAAELEAAAEDEPKENDENNKLEITESYAEATKPSEEDVKSLKKTPDVENAAEQTGESEKESSLKEEQAPEMEADEAGENGRGEDEKEAPDTEVPEYENDEESEIAEADEISSRIAKIRAQLGQLHQRIQKPAEVETDLTDEKAPKGESDVEEEKDSEEKAKEESTLEGAAYLHENASQPDATEAQVNEGADLADPEEVPIPETKEKSNALGAAGARPENVEEEALVAEGKKESDESEAQYDPELDAHLPKGEPDEQTDADEGAAENTGEGEAMLYEHEKEGDEEILDAPADEKKEIEATKPPRGETLEEAVMIEEATESEDVKEEKIWLEEVPWPAESDEQLLDIEALIAESADESQEEREGALQFDNQDDTTSNSQKEEETLRADQKAESTKPTSAPAEEKEVDANEGREEENASGDKEYPMYEEDDDAMDNESDFDESEVENEDEKDDESFEYGYSRSNNDIDDAGEAKKEADDKDTGQSGYSFSNWLKKITDPNYKSPEIEPEKPANEESSKTDQDKAAPDNDPVNRIDEKMELLDSFVEKLPSLKGKKVLQVDTKPDPEAARNQEESTDIVTETLARIYVKQGHYKKALQAYQILKLKYPDKEELFADQIVELKKKTQGK